jgi:hypothetical protein
VVNPKSFVAKWSGAFVNTTAASHSYQFKAVPVAGAEVNKVALAVGGQSVAAWNTATAAVSIPAGQNQILTLEYGQVSGESGLSLWYSVDGVAESMTGVTYPSGSGNAGNGTSGVFSFDARGRASGVAWTGPGSAPITSMSVTRSQGSRINLGWRHSQFSYQELAKGLSG